MTARTRGKLGILGGQGPEATSLFYHRVVSHTAAERDQEHIETLILSDTQIPDRTAAILSGDTAPAVERLVKDAKFLEGWGACCIAIPCNTSHTFLPQLRRELKIPVLNMIAETAGELKALGCEKAGVLATDGTVKMNLYQAHCRALGMEAAAPPAPIQQLVMSVIYDEVKGGRPVSRDKLSAIDGWLRQEGCDFGILACTELSVCPGWENLPGRYLDAMDVLARKCVEACGYPRKD